MRSLRGLTGALALAVAMAVGATPRAVAAPLEAYGRLPALEDIAISPDGATLAIVVTDGDARNLVIRDIATSQNRAVLRAGDLKVRDVRWAGSQHLIITTSTTSGVAGVMAPRAEWMVARIYDVQAGKQKPLLSGLDDSLNVLGSPPAIRIRGGKPFAYVTGYHFVDGRSQAGLVEVDVTTGTNRLVEGGQRDTREWIVDPDGNALAQAMHNRDTGVWALAVKRDGHWKLVPLEDKVDEAPDLVGLGRAAGSILLSVPREDGSVLREYAVASGKWSPPLPVRDADDVIYDPSTHQLVAIRNLAGDEEKITFFNPEDERNWNAVKAAYGGDRVSMVSSAADRKRFVVLVDSATQGPAYAVVDLAARKADWIGGRYQGLKPEDISPVRPIRFKAADGLELTGYLTVPQGKDPKALPLVVFPHGGPAARDEPGFNWWAQAMASRGYAVLQVNYRGSTGFGREFMQAGYGQWGRKMQTDLSDGVTYLAGQEIVDPKRVCIVGASYGGYAALAGVTLQPGLYRCAASVGGVSDLKRMLSWSRGQYGVATRDYWARFMGVENGRVAVLTEVSPVDNAAKADAPVLLIHGKDDTVVPLGQSQAMADALRRARRPVELIVEKGEDHWLTRGDTRLQTLTAIVAFLEKHNPPQ